MICYHQRFVYSRLDSLFVTHIDSLVVGTTDLWYCRVLVQFSFSRLSVTEMETKPVRRNLLNKISKKEKKRKMTLIHVLIQQFNAVFKYKFQVYSVFIHRWTFLFASPPRSLTKQLCWYCVPIFVPLIPYCSVKPGLLRGQAPRSPCQVLTDMYIASP